MSVKPQDFYIGAIDFFSVILPGALMTYFLQGLLYTDSSELRAAFPRLENTIQQWIAFLVVTYIIGNIIFLLAASLLDTYVYDKWLRGRFSKKSFDLCYHAATAIRDQHLPVDDWLKLVFESNKLKEKEVASIRELQRKKKQQIINTFKWSLNYLSLESPNSLVDIEKFVADSKFFRSLVITFLIIAALLFRVGDGLSYLGFIVLALLSLFLYADLRFKSNQRAFELIITIHHLKKGSVPIPDTQAKPNAAS